MKTKEDPFDSGVEYELYKDDEGIVTLLYRMSGLDPLPYDRLVYAMRTTPTGKEDGPLFFYIMRKVSPSEEVGHWITEKGDRVDDATEENLNYYCDKLKDGAGPYGSMNSETGYWETE